MSSMLPHCFVKCAVCNTWGVLEDDSDLDIDLYSDNSILLCEWCDRPFCEDCLYWHQDFKHCKPKKRITY